MLEALRADSVVSVNLAEDRTASPILTEIVTEARSRGIALRRVTLAEVERLADGQNAQGVVAEVRQRRLSDVQDLLAISGPAGSLPFFLALDQIQDPQNLGALLRTAEAAGVQGVIIPERRSAHVTGVVAKASAGAASHLPILEATNLVRAMQAVRKAGVWSVGLEGTATDSLFELDLNVPLLLVVGSEGAGLRRLVRQHCDFRVRLPMLGSIESLNAAVAGSIAMYEVVRQRRGAEKIE